MRTIMKAAGLFVVLALVIPAARAQEKKNYTPLKVQVVFSEFEGEKKVANLPYTLLVNAAEGPRGDPSKLRIGVRVPITTQTKDGPSTQYLNVGTDIDATAEFAAEGKFALYLNMRRSFIHPPGGDRGATDALGSERVPLTPLFRHFDAELRLLLKDGETAQSVWATDPVSGRVLRVDVTLNVQK
jgi:hypothetical protein